MSYSAHVKWLQDIIEFDKSMAEKTGDQGDEDKKDDLDRALEKRAVLESEDHSKAMNAMRERGAELFQGMVFVSDKAKNRAAISGRGDYVGSEAANQELDSGGDQLGLFNCVKIIKDGQVTDLDPKSEEYANLQREMGAMIEALKARSAELKKAGFTDKEIENEVWTPLVRQRAIPSNMVPDEYSHYAQVMNGASALYEQILEESDGTVGEESSWDKNLSRIRDVVDIAKVAGTEAMRFEFNSIIESSRVDLSKWIEWRDGDMKSFLDMKKAGESLKDFVKRVRGENNAKLLEGLTPAQQEELNEDPYNMDEELEGLSGAERDEKEAEILAKWSEQETNDLISANSATLEADPYKMTDDMTLEEKSEILQQWAKDNPDNTDAQMAGTLGTFNVDNYNTEMAERTDMFGEKTEAQAYMTGACAVVDTALYAAEQKRKKKRDKAEIIETVAGGLVSLAGAITSVTHDNYERAMDAETQTEQFQSKYGALAAKGVVKGFAAVVRLVEAKGDSAEIEKAITDLMTGIVGAYGATVASAIGAKEETEAASGSHESGDYEAAEHRDTRKDAANVELIMSAMGTSGVAVKNLIKLAKNKDWDAFAFQMSSLAVSAAGTGIIEAGGTFRNQVSDSEITEENYGGVGGIYNESQGQGAQGDYGFNGDMATKSDQKELEQMQAEFNELCADFDPEGDATAVKAAFAKMRNKVMSDPNAREAAAAAMEEERARLDQMMQEADPEAIMALEGGNADAAAERAMKRIEELTIQLKTDEARLNMMTSGIGFVLKATAMAAPGVSIGVKVFDMMNDIRIMVMRVQQLMIWRQNLIDSFGNYSIYTSAAQGEYDLKSVQTTMDAIKVAADILGVAAESLRVADATHIGASVLTTTEKSMKILSQKWYKKWSKDKIADGWETFKLARDFPENRRLARKAIRLNSTLAKCVMAYGACVERDPIATRMMASCGLTPEVLEDDSDVCKAVVTYLEAKLGTDTAVKGAHDGGDWFPKKPEMSVETFVMFKAVARTLKPPLDDNWFSNNKVDAPLKEVCGKLGEYDRLLGLQDPTQADVKALEEASGDLEGLCGAFLRAKPIGISDGRTLVHKEMKLALHAFTIEFRAKQRVIDTKADEAKSTLAAAAAVASAKDAGDEKEEEDDAK